MVNSTDSSSASPHTSAIQQHSGLPTQANDEGCNDDPPPIPQPPAGSNGSTSHDARAILAGGFQGPSTQQHEVNAQYQGNNPHGVTVRDYAARPTSSGEELYVSRTNELSSSETAATSNAASSNSSTIAVDAQTPDTVIDIASSDVYDGLNPHTVDANEVAQALGVHLTSGLSTAVAKEKLQKNGPNKLTSDGGITWYGVLMRQVSNSLTLVCKPGFALFCCSPHSSDNARKIPLVSTKPPSEKRLIRKSFVYPVPCSLSSEQLSLSSGKSSTVGGNGLICYFLHFMSSLFLYFVVASLQRERTKNPNSKYYKLLVRGRECTLQTKRNSHLSLPTIRMVLTVFYRFLSSLWRLLSVCWTISKVQSSPPLLSSTL